MAEPLDIKDKKLLLALDMDARASDSSIAKIVGLSKQLTNYRIKRLEKQEIILSYYPVIDHTKLGLQLYRIALKLENLSKEKEQEMINYLHDHAGWMVSVLGTWDIWMAIYAKNEFEFMKFWTDFYEKYGAFVENRWISLMTKFLNFERSFIYPQKKNRDKKIVIGENPKTISLDDVDLGILQELTKNARQTSLELSKKISQTERIVRYRIQKLENQKIILGYRPFINTHLLGFKYYKLFIQLKDITKQDLQKIKTYITQNPNVVYNTEALGGYDFEIEVHFPDSQELMQFISNLREAFPTNIKNVNHMEYIKEYKITYFPSSTI
ncbi:MAG: Lrp/AsnC family transcriptional regulator [Nanoarchaeota archaeon]|nr:Lrp/AsnC family transcriptional regulator [Nanoarchaeota archaeon]MBU1977194.1 Lrp/AsnC family transcriptional regulator [Nanoarchaeota archaeon]